MTDHKYHLYLSSIQVMWLKHVLDTVMNNRTVNEMINFPGGVIKISELGDFFTVLYELYDLARYEVNK